jgi:nucleotide-binding universal stress UspA family protein
MYKHILVATDGSELAGKALAYGIDLAKALNAELTAVTVSEPWSSAAPGEVGIYIPHKDYAQRIETWAREILEDAKQTAAKAGVVCGTAYVPEQYPAEGILEAAKERGCDLIVMASHGRRGIARLILGSQAAYVLSHSTIPVLICR